MSEPIDDARALIESRLAEINTEASALRRAIESLGEGSTSKPRRAARPPKSAAAKPGSRVARRPRAGKRAARGQRREELLAAIKASPGSRPSELAKVMGVRPTQVSVLIAKARGEKLIVKRGDGYALRRG